MKKTILQLVALAIVSLFCCSCEDNSSGKYPADNIRFLVGDEVSIKHPTQVIYTSSWSGWNPELYPMELWVEETEMATVDNQGYVTGHKLGTFTLHAKVMGKHGWVEGSKQFTVSDVLSQISISGINYFRRLGVDTNNDSVISASELERIEVLDERIYSDFLLSIAQYLPNLKEVSVIADTSSRTLDLSRFKLRKLTIIDDCRWSGNVNDYEQLKPFFLTELKLNNCLEHIIIDAMPGFPVMDLSEYTNLKTVSRDNSAPPQWLNMTFILPPNVESINLGSATILFNQVLYKLKSIELVHCMPIEIPKHYVPNLKRIIYKDNNYLFTTQYNRTLDISSYEASDLDEVKIDWINTLYVSQSVRDKFYLSADKIIIK